jgi:drug/metabolite transporter (DMT)-like permease
MKPSTIGMMLLLAVIWGVSFLLIRLAAPVLGPFLLVTLRMLIAGGALLIYLRVTRQALPPLRTFWRTYLVLGALNSALPLLLEAAAVVRLNASLTAILLTTAPLFTALIAAIWLHERLTLSQFGGLLVGLLGVGILLGWSPLPLTGEVILGIGAALLAALLYAVASLYARTALRQLPAVPLTAGQELSAGLLILPLALTATPATVPSLPVVLAMLVLALVMTAGGNLLFYHLLATIGPTRAQSVAFLIPVFALLAGVLLLDEPFTLSMLLGLAVISLSLGLVFGLHASPQRIRTLPTNQGYDRHSRRLPRATAS